jgi:hypothetical protein
VLERDVYDSINRGIIDLKKNESDINIKLQLIEESSIKEKEEDNDINEKIKNINTRCVYFCHVSVNSYTNIS